MSPLLSRLGTGGGNGGFGFGKKRGAAGGPPSWNYANNAALTQGKTTDVVSFAMATNVTSYSSSGTLPTGTSLSLAGGTLTLSGTLSQFGYAANSRGESSGPFTLSAGDFGVTRTFTITANGEARTFTHRQVGNLLISKTFESYGTPNNGNFVSLAAQQNDATTNPNFTTGGCNAGQVLSSGGVTSVTMNAENGVYGDPCSGTGKKLNVSYTI